MKVTTSSLIIIFLTMALLSMTSLTLAARNLGDKGHEQQQQTTRSRFLSNKEENEENYPRNFWLCKNDNDRCNYMLGKNNGTCCHHKCVDLGSNFFHCGACDNKCSLMEICCGGECANLGFDYNHCGTCNNKCKPGSHCVHGMCDYA